MNSGNGIGKPSAGDGEGRVQLFSGSGVITEEKNGHLTEEQARKYRRLVAEGMAEKFAAAAVRGEEGEL